MLSTAALLSGLCDLLAGAFLLLAPRHVTLLAGIAPASPPIFAQLNALFLIAVGAGFYLPWRDPDRHRGYLWVMGFGLKTAGAAVFLAGYLDGEAPRSFLLFAANDAALALLTLLALTKSWPGRRRA